jgi:hypothetical protein
MAGPKPNSIGTSALKSRIMNLAQTSVYQVKVQPPSGVETLLGGLYKKSGRDIDLLCTETTLPGSSLATHDVTADYHGVTEKMAYRRIYDDVMDMTFYVDKGYKVIDFFDGWINYISGMGLTASYNSYDNRRSGYRMSYPNRYKTDIFVTKFEKNIVDNALYYKFIDAFPIAMNSMAVSYGDSEILKVNVSFSYVRYTKQNLSSSSPERILQAQRDFERRLDQATTSTVAGVRQPVNFGLTGAGTGRELFDINAGRNDVPLTIPGGGAIA